MILLPQPRRVEMREGRVPYAPASLRVGADLPAQGYRLTVEPGRIGIAGADDTGLFYGRATLAQLRRVEGDRLPACLIEDWPDLPIRAVMLDIARDKVPTMGTLRELVDRLASWKVNQLQLYTEHTFAYRDHRDVWAESSPLTHEEVAELGAYCRERHMDLVPNQNCFGHMNRWLKHERYRPLAMAPDGWRNPKGVLKPPTTIDPAKPGSLELVKGLLGELVPCFGGAQVHVGLDEPWEMPQERYPEYVEWIRTLRSLPELDGREMLIWGDIVAMHPDSLATLPDDTTVCEWGYEDWHMFDERTTTLGQAGRSFWVAPGTSSWLTVVGRVENMRGNCAAATEAALAHGGGGFLNTDWGDMGHLQYLPVSEPGFAYGAAVSWCLDANRDLDLAAALNVHAFDDPTGELGQALVALGNAYRGVVPQMFNVSILVMHLYFPQLQLGRTFSEGLTIEDLGKVQEGLAAAVSAVERSRPRRADGTLVKEELRTGADLVSHMCTDAVLRLESGGRLVSIPEDKRMELAESLGEIMGRHPELWLARNRPGGLADSLGWLDHLKHCYESGTVDDDWGGW